MELALWTYEGPPHVGAMRIAASLRNVHFVLHAPQGDTYADLLFTMIERNSVRPPVTYTTFQARDLGSDTADLVIRTLQAAYERFEPELLLVGESCTAELIQDQPGALAKGMGLPVPVVPVDLPAYSKKENWGAAETFYRIVRTLLHSAQPSPGAQRQRAPGPPRANLLGPTSLGFRCRDDLREVTSLLEEVGVEVNVVAPLGAAPSDLLRIPHADFNVCLYPEIARTACRWLERAFAQPTVATVPIGIGATKDFLDEVAQLAAGIGGSSNVSIDAERSRLPWYSRSVDSNYLTGKRVFIFGDGSHALAAARVASEELGFEVVGLGTYSREMARDVRAAAQGYGVEPLISDNYLEVESAIAAAHPELVLGTQMERHIAKKLGIGCAVISLPVHVQDFPARYSPQMGYEGANVLFDSWVHPLTMGLEEHLITMFREDFEFNDQAQPSHLGHGHSGAAEAELPGTQADSALAWEPDAEKELKKIPFFVRGKARRNTEKYAAEFGHKRISVETLYDAKAHFSS